MCIRDRVYHIIKRRTDLEIIINKIKQQQITDPKLLQIRQRLDNQDDKILPFYCVHEDVLFIKANLNQNNWKVIIPKTIEKELIVDYHIRYGHMGSLKVIKALGEQVYTQNINRSVRIYVQTCHVCQLVKYNNERKEGTTVSYTHLDVYKRQIVYSGGNIFGPALSLSPNYD